MLFRILIFGYDISLLRTREMILRQGGYEVLLATDHAKASHILTEQPIHLLILCHTLEEEDRLRILSIARCSQQKLNILTLVASPSSYTSDGHDAILSSFDGPQTLLAAVHGLADTDISAA